MTTKTVISDRWELLPLEKKKLIKSAGYAVLGVLAGFLAMYLEQYGLPDKAKMFAPFVPTLINFLNKWAGEHTYTVQK